MEKKEVKSTRYVDGEAVDDEVPPHALSMICSDMSTIDTP